MKYLKRFNESNSDDFYLEISSDEWDILVSKRIRVEDSYKKIEDKVLDVFKEYHPEVKIAQAGMRIILKFGYNSRIVDMGIDVLPDEWFLVHINCSYSGYDFFKCDQLEGLYRFLEDKSKNNLRKNLFESVDNRTEDEKKEDIEDILIIEGIFEDWKLLGSRYFNQSGSMVYEFKVECKSDKKYLYRDPHDYNNYYNAYIFDNEVEEIRKRINHTRLHNLGCMVDIDWYGDIDQDDPYWEGGIYGGESKYKAIIRIKIIEPSWWKGKSIPFTDISDKEAGII